MHGLHLPPRKAFLARKEPSLDWMSWSMNEISTIGESCNPPTPRYELRANFAIFARMTNYGSEQAKRVLSLSVSMLIFFAN
jgi:hypothetical protein